MPGRGRKGSTTFYRFVKSSAENEGKGDEYNGLWNAKPKTQISVSSIPGTKDVQVRITIPFELVGAVPAKGDKWLFNASYNNTKEKYGCIWEYNLFQKNWRNIKDQQGIIVFE